MKTASGAPFGASSVDRYPKKEKIGGGAYGIVYKGIDTKTGEIVAVKKIKLEVQTEGIPSTALREITILRTLVHPNVVKYSVLSYYSLDCSTLSLPINYYI